MEGKNGILITGAARSGTSLVAGAINLCGAFGGKMYKGNSNNKKGMFENARIIQTMVKPYLKNIGADPLCQYPLPTTYQIPKVWNITIEMILKSEGYEKGSWMFKDAKIAMLWRIWNFHFPDIKWVIVRRKKSDIIESCMKTGFMRAFANKTIQKKVNAKNEYEGWKWWVEQHEAKFKQIKETISKNNWFEIYPEKMVTGDYTEIMNLIEWLGLEWNSDVLQFIDPLLWKSRHKGGLK